MNSRRNYRRTAQKARAYKPFSAHVNKHERRLLILKEELHDFAERKLSLPEDKVLKKAVIDAALKVRALDNTELPTIREEAIESIGIIGNSPDAREKAREALNEIIASSGIESSSLTGNLRYFAKGILEKLR